MTSQYNANKLDVLVMTKQHWQSEQVMQLFELPFLDLIYRAQTVHRENFVPNTVQASTLLNVKTGGCPEDCAYCPQSAQYATGVAAQKLMSLTDVIAQAKIAKENGASRFCMGAAWRSPPASELPKVMEMIKAVKELGLETCATLGLLDEEQTEQLKSSGLDFYNHNLDTSPEFYDKIISTRVYEDRLTTLENVRNSGMKVCCGGILGMGETRKDRINFLLALANLPEAPESLPFNRLIQIPGTPLEDQPNFDSFEFIRAIAVARIMFPKTIIRFSAGRKSVSDEMQTLCFMAGVNSIHLGDKLLITENNEPKNDEALLKNLKINFTPSANMFQA